jgi:hypothetical protein
MILREMETPIRLPRTATSVGGRMLHRIGSSRQAPDGGGPAAQIPMYVLPGLLLPLHRRLLLRT